MIWLFGILRIDREPTPYERFLFNWIFVPWMVLGLLAFLVSSSLGRNECKSACLTQEYADFLYFPRDKYRLRPESCVCFTEEEAKQPHGMKGGTDIWQ